LNKNRLQTVALKRLQWIEIGCW